ncbi:hypothetical protein [Methylobacterium sp. R2-1]|uniref:hypothetical protein n=1 Tax=Methylobacterium sp. R2-1 TaxID=2587064 RepID=UPI0016227D94|nr:hypothetical protein [Methylobacterium sp. R2-1]
MTIQGRFEKGFLHPRLITCADGREVALGRPGDPSPTRLDWARDTIGLGPKPDLPALTAAVEKAG